MFVYNVVALCRKDDKKMKFKSRFFKQVAIAVCVTGVLFSCFGISGCTDKTPEPTATPKPEETALYVSPSGSDDADGSENSPFASPERAVEEVRKLVAAGLNKSVTVYFHAGDYKVTNINFTEADNGTEQYRVTYKAFGDGDVIFNGGKALANNDFVSVTDEDVLSRLNNSAKDKIKVIDLRKMGLTRADIGEIYEIGTGGTASKYDDGTVGNNCELFWNDKRMTVARYPNTGFNLIEKVIDEGNRDDFTPGIVGVDAQTLEVMKTWKEPDKVWMFGYFKFNWADMTTPVKSIDFETGAIQPAHYSWYGYTEGAEYYFFNVLEELDAPGEYYIDRDNMLLYVYPPEDEADADALISVTTSKLITGNVSNVTFENIQFKGVRNDVIDITGDNNIFRDCKVLNSYGWAININGWNNLVYGCEVSYMGRGGIRLTGGDRATLTPGNNIVENCYVHHFEEVYRTYQQGIFVIGCGNKVLHNEIAYAPHCVLSYSGNDHLLAYNYIHDVVYESSDAGALYIGGDWTSCGTEIKYNLFENIVGTEGNYPKAIYFDDGMSSGTVYGNIIKNCSGAALNIGGGRDMVIKNNLVISDGTPIYYDDRFALDGWASIYRNTKPGEGMWTTLDRVPYKSELWQKRFPLLAKVTTDYADYLSPDFPANPAYSIVEHNIFVGRQSSNLEISDVVREYSTIGVNYSYRSEAEILEKGTYTVLETKIYLNNIPWEQIPYQDIGRYKN